jgi:hypothetical protein
MYFSDKLLAVRCRMIFRMPQLSEAEATARQFFGGAAAFFSQS